MFHKDPWKNVPLDRNKRCAMSPQEPDLRWRGILINTPEEITFTTNKESKSLPSFDVVPLCGFSMVVLTVDMIGKAKVVVMKNLRTNAILEGPIQKASLGTIDPLPDPSPGFINAVNEGMSIGGYFNVNIAQYVDIPCKPAWYEVFVRHGKTESNRVKIRVKEAPNFPIEKSQYT